MSQYVYQFWGLMLQLPLTAASQQFTPKNHLGREMSRRHCCDNFEKWTDAEPEIISVQLLLYLMCKLMDKTNVAPDVNVED